MWSSLMIPKDLSNRREIRLGLYRDEWRMTLSTFKEFTENRHRETGAWRGTIRQ